MKTIHITSKDKLYLYTVLNHIFVHSVRLIKHLLYTVYD